jgi:hypothetical protein
MGKILPATIVASQEIQGNGRKTANYPDVLAPAAFGLTSVQVDKTSSKLDQTSSKPDSALASLDSTSVQVDCHAGKLGWTSIKLAGASRKMV